MANFVTNKCKYELFTGDANLDAADLRMLLLKTAAGSVDSNFVSDLTPGSNEVTVAGYARQALAAESVTEDDTNDFAYLDADDPLWTGLATGETVREAWLFRQTGSDATAPVYACYDVTDTPTNGGDIGVTFATPANGGVLKGA
jgi:hypothetical protein